MGFFDKVRDVLTTSDAERARNARKSADKAAGQADLTRQDEQEHADQVLADGQQRADEAQRRADDAARRAGDPADTTTAEEAVTAQREADDAQREAAAQEAATYRTHTVRAGDTLAGIAQQHGADPRQMAELNRLDNPDLIYPGQVLRVPNG